MKKLLSDKIVSIPPSGIRKYFDAAAMMKGVVSLGVGEPDFATPEKIREAGKRSLDAGQTGYTSNSGLTELRKEISNYVKRTSGVEHCPEKEVLVTVGGSEAIDNTLRCILNSGDEVLLPEPAFVSYHPLTIMAGGTPVTIPLKNENDFKLTLEELQEYTTPKTKALILSFPNNPTGAVMTREDLAPLVDFIIENDIYVISDEIYAELTYTGEPHVSIASFPGMRERTVIINGFSKGFAMTGWRLGWVSGPQVIIEQVLKLHQYAVMCAPTTAQHAAIVALTQCDEDVKYMRDAYNERRQFLVKEFARLGLPCFEPFGAFYMFPSIKKFGLTSDEFATRLLEEQKLALVPGDAFGASGEGFLRISYAYSMEELQEAIVRLERFIQAL